DQDDALEEPVLRRLALRGHALAEERAEELEHLVPGLVVEDHAALVVEQRLALRRGDVEGVEVEEPLPPGDVDGGGVEVLLAAPLLLDLPGRLEEAGVGGQVLWLD